MARILIVDDAIFTRNLLYEILQKEGHQIIGEAENGLESVNLYKKLKPDLVTMDILMPEVEGLDGIGAVKAIIKEDPKARIIMVSAMGQHEIIIEAIRSGAKDFIIKPFVGSDINTRIERLIRQT